MPDDMPGWNVLQPIYIPGIRHGFAPGIGFIANFDLFLFIRRCKAVCKLFIAFFLRVPSYIFAAKKKKKNRASQGLISIDGGGLLLAHRLHRLTQILNVGRG
jgi:hypothetical protein